MKNYKYFKIEDGYLHPINKDWYNIDITELSFYYKDGQHRWFPHLAHKNWFTEDMFWELLSIARDFHPDVNFDAAIYQTSAIFFERKVYENWDFYQKIHELALSFSDNQKTEKNINN